MSRRTFKEGDTDITPDVVARTTSQAVIDEYAVDAVVVVTFGGGRMSISSRIHDSGEAAARIVAEVVNAGMVIARGHGHVIESTNRIPKRKREGGDDGN